MFLIKALTTRLIQTRTCHNLQTHMGVKGYFYLTGNRFFFFCHLQKYWPLFKAMCILYLYVLIVNI